jgi:2',3'-cyclic-nucleotide 2'-phosphodiesterase
MVESMKDALKALVIGDIMGQSGMRALFVGLPGLIRKVRADIVIVNAENAASGFGLLPELVDQIFRLGAHVITSGNHIWQKRDIYPVLESNANVLRPANYPQGAPGKGFTVVNIEGRKWGVLNLQGRYELSPINCPFKTAQDIVKKLRHESNHIVIDFHAESAQEKEALAWMLDGEVACVAGTHTHVQTGDERILPKGTGYITDVGMTGPRDSVIGMKTEICIQRSLSQMPIKMEVAEGEAEIRGALFWIDENTGRCLKVERIVA